MGCDIHIYYETQNASGEWETHDYRAKHKKAVEDRKHEWDDLEYSTYLRDPLYVGRCYRLFAFLADVRNGSGFAGCDTGDEVEPIDAPRGLPDDACDEACAAAYRYDGDGHSHSYFTGAELRDADWDQECIERGLFDPESYTKLKQQGHADGLNYCAGVSGHGVVIIDSSAWDVLAEDQRDPNAKYFIKAEWRRALKDELAYYYNTWLPAVLALHPDPEKVRIVFFFDN